MMTRTDIVIRLGAVCLLTLSASGQWAVSYVEDPSRVDPAAATDQAEKDYAWGDLDRDGDIDLVVVRKQPWTTTGRRANMLLMNENGVLTDRTAEYASASDVVGDQGFLTPTNDRDVVIADVREIVVLMADTIEGDVSGWTIVNDPSLIDGGWETASPNATLYGGGVAAPGADATPAPGTMAFVTANGPPGSAAASFDVDGGPTYLLSPIVDLGGSESVVRYARWAFTADGMPDALAIEVSDDGGDSWVLVESVSDTGGSWETAEFLVGDYVTVSSQLRVRFGVCDCPNDSVTEAGIDDFEVIALCSNEPCPWDLGGDGNVGINDFLALLGAWGPNPGHPADFDGDDVVGILDFLVLLGSWGPCP